MHTFVVAEPGCTAQGDFDVMCELIRVAADCGADAFKPQWVSSAAAHLQRRTANLTADERADFYAKYEQAYHWLEWPLTWHGELAFRTHNLGMAYVCSVCLPQDVWPLEPYVDRYKVSSFEALDGRLIRAARSTAKPVVVSLGMQSLNGLEKRADGVCLLQCTSVYPATISDANLAAIRRFFLQGYSDHTRSLIAGSQAVAYGATIVEAHYRLDACDPENPDYPVAFTPAEFAQYIKYIRDAEAMRGDGKKTIQPSELAMLRYKVGA